MMMHIKFYAYHIIQNRYDITNIDQKKIYALQPAITVDCPK